MRYAIAAVVITLSACAVEGPVGPQGEQGPVGPAAGAPLESGTRIKMRVGTTPDGAKMFLGWFDSELGVDCEFRLSSDGVNRCMPPPRGAGLDAIAGQVFVDPECKEVVAVYSSDGVSPGDVVLARSPQSAVVDGKPESAYAALRIKDRATIATYTTSRGECRQQQSNQCDQMFCWNAEALSPENLQPLAETIE